MRIWNYFKRTKCLVRGASFWDIYVNMLPFNSFEMSFLLICNNCPLQSLVSLMFWNNMTIVSWLPPMPETVFFFFFFAIETLYRPIYKFMTDYWRWDWYTMRASHFILYVASAQYQFFQLPHSLSKDPGDSLFE